MSGAPNVAVAPHQLMLISQYLEGNVAVSDSCVTSATITACL